MINVPLDKIVYLYEMNALVETEPDDEEDHFNPECPIGAFRLIDLASSSECTPEVFRDRLLEQSPIPVLKIAAAQTEPILVLDRLDYRESIAAVKEETQAHGLVAYDTHEVHQAYVKEHKERRARLSVEQPHLVLSIRIEGSRCRDMYDDHPGLAYFYTQSSVGVNVPKPLPLTDAMDAALVAWKEIHGDRDNRDPDTDDREYDGMFTPSNIVLFNAADAVIQEFDGVNWIREFAPENEWDSMIKRADELDRQGSQESGWDNFSTAERYHNQATSLRRQVSIARANLAASPASVVTPGVDLAGDPVASMTLARLDLERPYILAASRPDIVADTAGKAIETVSRRYWDGRAWSSNWAGAERYNDEGATREQQRLADTGVSADVENANARLARVAVTGLFIRNVGPNLSAEQYCATLDRIQDLPEEHYVRAIPDLARQRLTEPTILAAVQLGDERHAPVAEPETTALDSM